MYRGLALALLGALTVQDGADSASEKTALHADLAAAAESVGDQLIKLKAWDEARAFLEMVRAKSDARGEALDKLIAKTEKQSSGLKWDAKPSELIKSFGAERAKKFFAYAKAWKERDAEASRWTEAEAEILDDFLDYVKAYARLTQIRSHYELPKTRFDWKLSVPAVWHAKYELLNPDDSIEIPGKPGYTPEGKRAGGHSIKSLDETLSDLLEGVIHAPYYRNYVFHPGLLAVGLGQAQDKNAISVIDVRSGLGPVAAAHSIQVFPRDKAENISISGYDDHVRVVRDKSMKSMGYPITVTVYDPQLSPKEVKARLTERMKDVECYLSTPEVPTVPIGTPHIQSTIAIVPKDLLRPATEYRVSVRFLSNGKERALDWTFKTRR